MSKALDLIDAAIAELEAKLNLKPGEILTSTSSTSFSPPHQHEQKEQKAKKEKKEKPQTNVQQKSKNTPSNEDQPDICKLEFKVGVIKKVWVHPESEKLFCEEIDVGEEQPRLIASGLRPYYSIEEMEGRKLIIVSNLKPKKIAGFTSAGMVLCAAGSKEDGTETVVFVEPPKDAIIGEVVYFDGLPQPQPFSGAQVEKKKVFQSCADGMKTTDEGVAAWNGHVFLTSAGPCTSSIRNAPMR